MATVSGVSLPLAAMTRLGMLGCAEASPALHLSQCFWALKAAPRETTAYEELQK